MGSMNRARRYASSLSRTPTSRTPHSISWSSAGATRWPGATRKIKSYARQVIKSGFAGKPFAAFSTGGTVFDEKPNLQASEQLYDLLEKGGLTPLARPFIAGMKGYKPPGRQKGTLPETEVARAVEFGRELGAKLSEQQA